MVASEKLDCFNERCLKTDLFHAAHIVLSNARGSCIRCVSSNKLLIAIAFLLLRDLNEIELKRMKSSI